MGELVESEPKSSANSGVSRRQLLARSAVAAGVVWAAPVVRTASAYAATSAGTSRPCTQFFAAGLSLSGNWFPAYPYGFAPSLEQTSNLEGTAPPTTTTTTVPLATNNGTPSRGGAMAGVQTRRTDGGPRKMTRRELATFLADTTTDGAPGKYIVPKLIEEWVRENASVPLIEPTVYPQITQTGAQGWAVLLPEVTGPNAPARQPRFILGYSWQGTHYAYGYVDPQPANPVLAGRRILFPSPVGREPGVGDEPTTTPNDPRRRRRRSTTTSSSTSSTSSTTTTSPVAPTTATTKPGTSSFGPAPTPTTTSTSSTTTTSTTTTTTTTLPPTTTTSSTTTTTTTTLPPTTTTTRPGWGKGGSKSTTTTAPPPTTTTVPPTTTTSTTTTTVPGGGSTTTTTTTSPGGTTTTTTDPMALWWITANSSTGDPAWDALVPKGSRAGGTATGNGATSGSGRKAGFVDTGVGPAGPAGPGALSPTDARPFADYFADGEGPYEPPQGSPIKGVILIYCQP